MSEKRFPTLYKKTSTGKIQEWTIAVRGHIDWAPSVAIYTWHGQVGGKIQETFDMISEGKNIGKKNETTPEQQGIAEAQAKWEKQKKKGYVESLEGAESDQLDDLIAGGIVPMLAHKYSEQGHKIKYPAFFQPKLDGIRCIAIVKDGECTLWSRTRKPITSCPHIVAELEAAFPSGHIALDGELYNHDYKDNFEKIVSLVRQEEPADDHMLVQYHVYDIAAPGTFRERWTKLIDLLVHYDNVFTSIFLVSTGEVNSEDKVMDYFDAARAKGFEGLMLRNADAQYANKRSYDLQKVKEFDDNEFPIVGIEEGRGKLAGHAIFICKTKEGKEFTAKIKGSTDLLKKYFEDHSLWQNKQLSVQYQGFTIYDTPRFPVGIAVRDYE